MDCSWSQCFKNHYAQTYARHGFQLSHSLCQATLEQQTASEASRLDCCWVVQSYVLWWKLILHFLWKSGSQSLEEERRGTESTLLEVQCKVSTVSDGLGCHVICWCWSTVFSEVQGQHSRIPGRFRALHASCCWPSLWRCRFHFPTGLGTCTQCQSYQYLVKDHGIPVLNWPASSPDLSPIENLWGIVKRKMRYARPNNAEELKATIRATWALITPEQCHRLIDSMPRRIAAVIQAKGAPTKYWVLYMLILFMFILFSWPRFLKILSLYWS